MESSGLTGALFPSRTPANHEHAALESRADMKGIVGIQLARLQKLLSDRKLTLDVDDKAKAWLGEVGYDPVYGARPLKRVIQRELQNPLAEMILAGRITDGETVHVTTSGEDTLKITGDGAAKAAAA